MTRWLSLSHAAEHLDISIDSLRRLVREGRLPQPDRSLGQRMPRWDREALDKAMSATPSSNAGDLDQRIEAWINGQNTRRTANAR